MRTLYQADLDAMTPEAMATLLDQMARHPAIILTAALVGVPSEERLVSTLRLIRAGLLSVEIDSNGDFVRYRALRFDEIAGALEDGGLDAVRDFIGAAIAASSSRPN